MVEEDIKKDLHVIKQVEFSKIDSEQIEVVIKYITKGKKQDVIVYQVYINKHSIGDSEVFNFANIYYDMFNINKTISKELDIMETFNRYLNISGKWKVSKGRPRFNQEHTKVYTYPYLDFEKFDKRLKDQWFENQYNKNNIKIGEYTNE